MIMMLLMCISLGAIFSYVTIKIKNCMYAAIMHGVVNVIGEVPVFMTYHFQSGLLGPNPTGLIGMSFFIIVALILLAKMNVKCCNID